MSRIEGKLRRNVLTETFTGNDSSLVAYWSIPTDIREGADDGQREGRCVSPTNFLCEFKLSSSVFGPFSPSNPRLAVRTIAFIDTQFSNASDVTPTLGTLLESPTNIDSFINPVNSQRFIILKDQRYGWCTTTAFTTNDGADPPVDNTRAPISLTDAYGLRYPVGNELFFANDTPGPPLVVNLTARNVYFLFLAYYPVNTNALELNMSTSLYYTDA